MTTKEILESIQEVRTPLSIASTELKNSALSAMAIHLMSSTDDIIKANKIDIENAKGKISDVMLDRLSLNKDRITDMANGIKDVIKLNNPIGKQLSKTVRPNGLIIKKVTVPMGIIAIIYESRPNVTSDAAALAIKAGSGCILRCGKEAYNSCKAIVTALQNALQEVGLPKQAISLIEDTTHQSANELMKANGLIDLLIPRGGKNLIRACSENATIPTIQTGTGICHIYVDKYADLNMAVKIVENAKTSRVSVCNAQECLLVHKDIAEKFLPMIKKRLVDIRKANGLTPVELHLDENSLKIIDGIKAQPIDYDTEYLDYKLSVAIVDDVDKAIQHITKHSTHHSEAIITENKDNADKFTKEVDSAAVYINASTRFTDGGQFGLGCEMGISTQKLHARGPMGLEELCSYKYIIYGDGQIRDNSQKDNFKTKTILITGFEPFAKESINPSWLAVKALPETINDYKIYKLELPTEYENSTKLLKEAIQEIKPEVVICVGQAGGKKSITIEKVAINLLDYPIKDNSGYQPIDELIKEKGPTAYFSTLPIKKIVEKVNEANISCEISYSAGTFVCNSIMYTLLDVTNNYYPNIKAGFIHVPYSEKQVKDKASTPSMKIEDISKAILIAIKTTIDN